MSLSSLHDPFAIPGMGDPLVSDEREFTWGRAEGYQIVGGVIASTAVDAGNTPTTTLRRGLVMGIITASKTWAQYDATATDGTQYAEGVLMFGRNLYSAGLGATSKRQATFLKVGCCIASQLIGLDDNARVQLFGRITFDDYQLGVFPRSVEAKTSSYTVLATDSFKQFTTTGAAGAVTFTLPTTIVKGFRARFTNTVDQNMIVAAPSGKLVTFNNAAATSVAFSTSGNKIGGSFEIFVNDAGTKYCAVDHGANTVTVA